MTNSEQKILRKNMFSLGFFEEFLMMEEADRRGISYRRTKQKFVIFEKLGRKLVFRRGWSDLNAPMIHRIAMQKEVLSRILRHKGLPATENTVFGAEDSERAWRYAEPVLPVVVKPHASIKGRNVHVDIRDRATFQTAFDDVSALHGCALVERFYDGHSLRVTTVGGKVRAAYIRSPASVTGDGTSSIRELIECENAQRDGLPRNSPLDPDDPELLAMIGEQRCTLDTVLAQGRLLILSRVLNRNRGAVLTDITDDLTSETVRVVEEASAALPGLAHGGWDVLLTDTGPMLLELNTDSGFASHNYVRHGTPRNLAPFIMDVKFGLA